MTYIKRRIRKSNLFLDRSRSPDRIFWAEKGRLGKLQVRLRLGFGTDHLDGCCLVWSGSDDQMLSRMIQQENAYKNVPVKGAGRAERMRG